MPVDDITHLVDNLSDNFTMDCRVGIPGLYINKWIEKKYY